MTPLVAGHAIGATLALMLGGVNLLRRVKGDSLHRRLGWVWVAAMYWTVFSSFFIREIKPGQFSWIHGLSVFTVVTLSIGVWAAATRRIAVHRGFMRGSYLGTVGAFIGAIAVPQRAIPQLAVQHPLLLSGVALAITALACVIAAAAQRTTGTRPEVETPFRKELVGRQVHRTTINDLGSVAGESSPKAHIRVLLQQDRKAHLSWHYRSTPAPSTPRGDP